MFLKSIKASFNANRFRAVLCIMALMFALANSAFGLDAVMAAHGIAVGADSIGMGIGLAGAMMSGEISQFKVAEFDVNPSQTAIAIAYKNSRLIQDEVLPRTPVTKQVFQYKVYPEGEQMVIPDTRVGRSSEPNQVTTGYKLKADATEDFGLDDPVPVSDIQNAEAGFDPVNHATEYITSVVAVDRERRVATLVTDSSNYAADNHIELAGNTLFSAKTTSTPIDVISDGMLKCFLRPNVHAMGIIEWNKLRKHPDLIKSIMGNNSSGKGMISRQQYCDLFEIEKLLIGEAYLSSTKDKENPVRIRVWGESIAMLYIDTLASTQGGLSFGMTAQWGTRIAGTINDQKKGLRGTVIVRAGESVKELITCPTLGYLITDHA